MKTTKPFAAFSGLLLAVLSAHAQSLFQNLNFEQANPISAGNPNYHEAVTFGSALPGWSGAIGGVPVTQAILNDYSLGSASIDLFGPNWNYFNPGVIDGNYSVYLQSGANPQGGSVGVGVSLSQYGTIPASAESFRFSAWSFLPSGTLYVSFDGNSLSPVLISSGETPTGQMYDVYGADISAYAGQTGQLQFTVPFGNHGQNGIELDDIAFSPNAVPEPSTLALIVMGGLALAARRRRAKGIR